MISSGALRRNLVLFPLSFLGSGLGNVVPQLFFRAHAPAEKERLLAACLLAGALVSLAGVAAGRALQGWALQGRAQVGTLAGTLSLVAVGAVFLGALGTASLSLFISAYLGLRLLLNAQTQVFDRRAVGATPADERRGSDFANTVYRLLGMMLGSFYFALFFDAWQVSALLLAGLVAAAAWSVAASATPQVPTAAEQPARQRTTPGDHLVVAAGTCAYATLYLFGANLTYLLADWLHVAEPGRLAGWLLLAVYGASVLGAGLVAWLARWRRRPPGLDALPFAMASVLIGGGALLALTPLASQLPVLLTLSAAMGVAHAFFLSEARDHSTRGAAAGRTGLLAGYNNMANAGAVLGFAAMTALAATPLRQAGLFHPALLGVIATLAALSGAAALAAARLDPLNLARSKEKP